MTGDPLSKTGELQKVLGLRMDTEKDKISVDVKINYDEKKKGANTEDSKTRAVQKPIFLNV